MTRLRAVLLVGMLAAFGFGATTGFPSATANAWPTTGAIAVTADQAVDQIDGQEAAEAAEAAEADEHGETPPIWLVLPFVLLLLMIATGPLFYAHHWHHNYPRYAVAFGLFVSAYYIFGLGNSTPVVHAIQEYIAFMALVASLFIAASGIYVKINARGAPLTNVVVLFCASVVSNLIATTGAAMLFIRAYIRLNKGRVRPYHIVFFIFTVANVAGALTPIGDPPLFLGFLRGVPFFWTFTHTWYIWLPTLVVLLSIFYVMDSRNKDRAPDPDPDQPVLAVEGRKSFLWILVIVLSVFLDPNVLSWVPRLNFGSIHVPFGIREVIMIFAAVMAYRTADKTCLERNEFTFEPVREVGWLFLGIFATMQPALASIASFAQHNADSLGVGTFYWATGLLSAVLDNAPTYLNFLSAAMGKFVMDVNDPLQVKAFAENVATSAHYLQAISVGAVFFGAMTYIGNAPNFMVKAIAESSGVETPSFVTYIVKYSLPILLPVYFLIYVIFFSGWVLQ